MSLLASIFKGLTKVPYSLYSAASVVVNYTQIFKGIVQLFELGGEPIHSICCKILAAWQVFLIFFKFNDTISREEHKTNFSGLRISEMTLSSQSHFYCKYHSKIPCAKAARPNLCSVETAKAGANTLCLELCVDVVLEPVPAHLTISAMLKKILGGNTYTFTIPGFYNVQHITL